MCHKTYDTDRHFYDLFFANISWLQFLLKTLGFIGELTLRKIMLSQQVGKVSGINLKHSCGLLFDPVRVRESV